MRDNNSKFRKFAEKLPLEKFIPAAFLIFLLCFIVLSIITYNNITLYKSSVELIDHTNKVLRKTDEINFLLSSIQLHRRSYVVKGDEKYYNKYREFQNTLVYEIGQLKLLTSDNNAQQLDINTIDSLSKNIALLLDSSITLYRSEKQVTAEQTGLAMQSQEFLEALNRITARIKDEEFRLLEERQQASKDSLTNTQAFIIITSLFAFAVLGLSLFVFDKLIRNKNETDELLKRSYEELEDKVEDRTAELKKSNEDLVNEINNRIKIENSLRESESRFREMADSAPALIWISGTDKRCEYFNKGWLDFRGRTLAQETGNGWVDGIFHEDLERCLNTYAASFENREPFEIEYRLQAADGDFRWILSRGIPRYTGGEFAGYIGIAIDIHEKKRTERYLKIQYSVTRTLAEALSTEEALQNVLENICTGVNWKLGIAWVVENEKLMQKAIWSEIPSDAKNYSAVFSNSFVLEKGSGLPGKVWETAKSLWIENADLNEAFRENDGFAELGWQTGFAVPIKDGDRVIAVIECFNRNALTAKYDLLEVLESAGKQVGNFLERKKAEENLKIAYDELEQKVNERTIELANTLNRLLDEMAIKEKVQNRLKLYGHALRGIKECVFISNLQNRTIFVNPAFESVYGYMESELLDKNIPVLYTESISDGKRREILSEALKNGWKGELVNRKSDGSEFFVYLSASVIRDEEGKVDAIVGIVQDITAEKNNLDLLEKRFSLLNLVNEVATEANTFTENEPCIQYSIDKVCEYTGWDIGHFLIYEGSELKSSGIWNKCLKPEYEVFRVLTEEIILGAEHVIQKEVIREKKPVWIDISLLKDTKIYKRAELCRKIGLLSCIWVPVIDKDEVIGVLEFFTAKDIKPDKEILDSIVNISNEIRSVIRKNDYVKEIKEREKHFSAIADTANDSIITADSRGEIIYVNSSTAGMFGYSIDEIIGSSLTRLMPDRYIPKHQSAFSNAAHTGVSLLHGKTLELTGKKKDGTEFPIELSIAKWELNDQVYFTGMIRDISPRKMIENELIENRNSLLEAQSIAKLGNWQWDVVSDKVNWSDEMYNIYEITKDDFDNSYEGFLNKLHPDDRESIKAKISDAFLHKEPFEFNERIVTPSGKIKVLRSSGGVKLDSNGNVAKMVGTCLDITLVHEAEKKIRENEERLSLIMENIKDYAIILLDEKGHVKSWNPAAEFIKGYKQDEIIGKHISEFYIDEDIEKGSPEYNLEMAAAKGRYESQGWRKRKDGSRFWADIIFSALYDGKKLKGFVKVTRDITERKNAERDLIESEKRLKEAQEIAKMGSWEWDAVTDKVKWSSEMYNIFEIKSTTEITQKQYLDLLDEDNRKIREDAIQAAMNGDGSFDYYLSIKSTSGKIKIIHSQGEIEKDSTGKVTRMVGTFMDVTEMKEAEEKIRQSEKQLKEAQSIAKLGSWQAELKTGSLHWSDEMYRIYEFKPGIDSISYSNLRKFIYHKDLQKMDELIDSLEKKPQDAEIDYRIVTPSGRLKYLSLDLRVEYDKRKKPLRLYGSVQDITEIKLVEEELRKTNAKLIEAQKELIHNEKLAALGRFSSGIAHEIRNPLANISALAQLLEKSKIEDEKMKKHLKYILVNSDIANKIIKDLLNFASPEDLIYDNFPASELLENTMNSVEARCSEKHITLSKDISPELPVIHADKVKLENALLNFISNAIDAIDNKGSISVKAREDKIKHWIIIDIIDNGKGIPQENLDKIFEPFFTTKETGTGLGLGLAYQYIKSHNGILNIFSEPGKGTHVEIKLPVKENK
ncbi:MAG TPA: PAS domain S-box protein [Ignavibacteria bacterium]|nr:PAS domain S-box protein [Ignavibacteria bacterium]